MYYQSKDQNFYYYSFVYVVEEEFHHLNLNGESAGYAWVNIGNWPKPLHNGAKLRYLKMMALTNCILYSKLTT